MLSRMALMVRRSIATVIGAHIGPEACGLVYVFENK